MLSGVSACRICELNATIADQPPAERAYMEDHWRVAHAWSALAGWLIVTPLRHVTSLADLTGDEAAALGPLLADASAALTEVVGCDRTYVVLFAEQEGFGHVHFHVVPRMSDLPREHRSVNVFYYLSQPEETWVPAQERDRLAEAIGAAIRRRR
jgi:diadenosine tetraphosphate (Ap4A) HIT family hydrolase